MIINKIKNLMTALLIIVVPQLVFADIVVIGNRDLPANSLSRDELSRIYLGKTKYLSSGIKVVPVDQRSGSMIREKFYNDLFQKSESEMKAYWSRIMFTGQGYPPIQENDDTSVLETVAKNANCLGYIERSALNNSVKVLYSLP
jgi:ABC-type phosphate transport system substrate-binding protein